MPLKKKKNITLARMKETIEVTFCISQGCSISTLLFKMVTFCIIEDPEKKGKFYEIDKYIGNSLWLTDDAKIIAGSKENMKRNIEVLIELAGEYSLKLNELKTKVLHVRRIEVEKIGEYTVEEEVKYLGIQLEGKERDIFRAEKRLWLEKAVKKAK